MKIADALLLKSDLTQEISRLRELAKNDSWRYVQRGAGEELVPQFDLDKNIVEVRKLTLLNRRLSRAISRANNTTSLKNIDTDDYKEWM